MTNATSDASSLPVSNSSLSPAAPAAEAPTYRDIQRAALGDLVSLAKECAATENEVEIKYKTDLEQIAKDHESAVWSANQRHKTNTEQVQEKATEKASALSVKRKAELFKLASAADQAQDKVRQEYEPQSRKYKQKYDQAVWLAESGRKSNR